MKISKRWILFVPAGANLAFAASAGFVCGRAMVDVDLMRAFSSFAFSSLFGCNAVVCAVYAWGREE